MKLRVQALRGARDRRAWSLAVGRRGVITLLGVTAGNASHNASNARGVTAGKMGRNSSVYNFAATKLVLLPLVPGLELGVLPSKSLLVTKKMNF